MQAEQVYQAHPQKARVGRTVRRVATGAAVGFDRHVLVDIGTLLIGMTLEAGGIARGEFAHLAHRSGSVHVVAVSTLDQFVVDAVAIRPAEFGALRGVACVAEFRLLAHEQMVGLLGMMRTVTVDAADIVAQVGRRCGVMLHDAFAVALKAAPAGLGAR